MILFARIGFAKPVQLGDPGGQVISTAKLVVSSEEFGVLVTPADCGHDAVPLVLWHSPGGALAKGVPIPKVSTPDEASESLCAMVLLVMFTLNESCSEMPAPSQPATLLLMMLLVMVTSCHRFGCVLKV